MPLEEVPEAHWVTDWYVATYLNDDLVNVQAFSKLRGPGQQITSRSRRGFRIFRHPTDITHFGYTPTYLPWLRIWKVRPTRVIGHENAVELRWVSNDPTVCRARTIQIVEQMPVNGFEFGVCGAAVKRLMHRMAEMDPLPKAPAWSQHPDYDEAISPAACGASGRPVAGVGDRKAGPRLFPAALSAHPRSNAQPRRFAALAAVRARQRRQRPAQRRP